MTMDIEIKVFLAYAAGIMLVYLFGRCLAVPLKWIAVILISSIFGGASIFLINAIGAGFGILIPLNAVTALISGVLGVPGVLMLIMLFI